MSSAVPAAVSGLLAALEAAPALSGVDVHDGPPVIAESQSYVCVGYQPGTTVSVEFTQAPAAMRGPAGHSRNETFDILCALNVTSGDLDMSARRASAFALLATVEDILRSNITLSGAVQTAQLTAGSLEQGETTQGEAAGIRFRVSCRARI